MYIVQPTLVCHCHPSRVRHTHKHLNNKKTNNEMLTFTRFIYLTIHINISLLIKYNIKRNLILDKLKENAMQT